MYITPAYLSEVPSMQVTPAFNPQMFDWDGDGNLDLLLQELPTFGHDSKEFFKGTADGGLVWVEEGFQPTRALRETH